jgi:preprotein translocase subunit YajC
MLISPAYAQAAGGSSGLIGLTPFILLFVIFYFLLIRPQQKKVKEHKAMLEAIRRGDRIVTNGGIVGLVTKVLTEERALTVEIAENIKVKVMRDMVANVLSKTEPVPADKADADDAGKDK